MIDDENLPELWKDKKTVNILFEYQNNIFLKPTMLKKKHTKIQEYVSEDQWHKFLKNTNDVLRESHIAIGWFVLWAILGGIGCVVILFLQRKRTRAAAKKLAKIVDEMNEYCREVRKKRRIANERLVFQLPLPSIPGVLVTAVFQEKRED